jgi:hypothetical protein
VSDDQDLRRLATAAFIDNRASSRRLPAGEVAKQFAHAVIKREIPLPPEPKQSHDNARRAEGYTLIAPPPGQTYGWLYAPVTDGYDGHMGTGLSLVLPLPPSKNRITGVRAIRKGSKWIGTVFETKVAREYKAVVKGLLSTCPLYAKPQQLYAEWRVVFPRAGADLLNPMESGFDALEGIAFENDSQIAQLGPCRREVGDWPRWELFLAPSKFDAYGRLA